MTSLSEKQRKEGIIFVIDNSKKNNLPVIGKSKGEQKRKNGWQKK